VIKENKMKSKLSMNFGSALVQIKRKRVNSAVQKEKREFLVESDTKLKQYRIYFKTITECTKSKIFSFNSIFDLKLISLNLYKKPLNEWYMRSAMAT